MIERKRIFALLPLVAAGVLSLPLQAQTGVRNLAQFRADLKTYLEEMRQVSAILEESPMASEARKRAAIGDPESGIAGALAVLPYLSDKDLTVLHDSFHAVPAWRESPATLRALFTPEVRASMKAGSTKAAGSPVTLAVSGATCNPGPGTPMGITDLYIAKGVALGLNLLMEGFPTDGLTIAARIAPIAAWGVAEGAALVLEGLNAVEAECLGAKFEDFVTARLDVATGTRASEVNLNAARTAVNNVQNTVDNGFAASQVAVAAVQTSINNVQTSVNTAQAALNTINAKVDALQASFNAGQERDLRLKIEANLSLPPEGTRSPVGNPARMIALFYLPASQGGYLSVSRAIVEDTIRRTAASGESTGAASARLAAADAAIAESRYKAAYQLLGQAYREATQSN